MALEYLHRALAIRLKLFGEGHPNVGDSFYNIGTAYNSQEKNQEAVKMFEKARDVYGDVYGGGHAKTKDAENKMAELKRY